MGSDRKSFLTARELCIMSLLTVILFLQEQILNFLPNIQLTVFLMLLYTKCLGLWKTGMIVTVYVLLDSAFMGSLNPPFTGGQWVAWMAGVLLIATVFRKTENVPALTGGAVLMAFLYCWIMILPTMWLLHVEFLPYLASDLLFEVILAASSALSTLLLYEPLSKLLRKLLKYTEQN
ncbi:MAG: hypothetical protein ILP12_00500 [Lachnospiraceae bacterium]|nr:hypothetical protein [Lachnospiraceae bacterium]